MAINRETIAGDVVSALVFCRMGVMARSPMRAQGVVGDCLSPNAHENSRRVVGYHRVVVKGDPREFMDGLGGVCGACCNSVSSPTGVARCWPIQLAFNSCSTVCRGFSTGFLSRLRIDPRANSPSIGFAKCTGPLRHRRGPFWQR